MRKLPRNPTLGDTRLVRARLDVGILILEQNRNKPLNLINNELRHTLRLKLISSWSTSVRLPKLHFFVGEGTSPSSVHAGDPRDALQVQEVWTDIFKSDKSHESSHWRETIQLQGLWKAILSKRQPDKSHDTSHRREAIQLQGVWKEVLSKG